ncbi:MAG: hypothetical protein M0Z62_07790 [Actinomycetota bacterium]|nr:hypothetical protein [Actinomycetota bacterium]
MTDVARPATGDPPPFPVRAGTSTARRVRRARPGRRALPVEAG